MTKLQILSVQIQTDMNSIIEDMAQGISAEEIMKGMVMLNEKIKKWGLEAEEVLTS